MAVLYEPAARNVNFNMALEIQVHIIKSEVLANTC